MVLKVVENVLRHWSPANSLMSLAKVACVFMMEDALRPIVCESPHMSADSDEDGEQSSCEIVEKVYIPGASYLHVTFDPRSLLLL